MANVWMHNGFLQVEGEKMSKSLGNFITIHELLRTETFGGRRWSGETLRLAMLRTHYRQPIDWTVKALEEAQATLDRWYEAIGDSEPSSEVSDEMLDALSDDLNTPAALSELYRLERNDSAHTSGLHSSPAAQRLKTSANLLGLLQQTRSERQASALNEARVDTAHIDAIIAERGRARVAKNWAESDRLRDELAALGVAIKDSKDGATTWELKR
jgi:cysteinyl-tRNA synthetase